ncbi:MAG: hypothetical protein KJ697_02945 [Nanoarchaeota archaeon]|nr:hypothetical protein [Nanoarchaeota archaeon]MBU4072450.1 hypothetical protein [Candidatus Thermoplasmatota archaeon]MBU4124421.1 hypothetical protein [Nanoarchaeota archaeon]
MNKAQEKRTEWLEGELVKLAELVNKTGGEIPNEVRTVDRKMNYLPLIEFANVTVIGAERRFHKSYETTIGTIGPYLNTRGGSKVDVGRIIPSNIPWEELGVTLDNLEFGGETEKIWRLLKEQKNIHKTTITKRYNENIYPGHIFGGIEDQSGRSIVNVYGKVSERDTYASVETSHSFNEALFMKDDMGRVNPNGVIIYSIYEKPNDVKSFAKKVDGAFSREFLHYESKLNRGERNE